MHVTQTFATAAAALLCAVSVQAAEFYCPAAPAAPQDRRTNTSTLRVVQFNAEWLFINSYSGCPGTKCPWGTPEAAETHLEAIASVIKNLNGDIVNLCEVEGCDELTQLTKTPDLADMGYLPYMVQGKDSSTGENVGLLTKIDPSSNLIRTEARVEYPIPNTKCNSSYYGTYGVSKHYITTFEVSGIKIAMFGMHLLAFPDDQTRCIEREAQATVMRDAITPYVQAGYEIIALGDINDWDETAVDRNDNYPISQVADILRGGGTNWTLTNVATKMPKMERYSLWYDENVDCVYTNAESSLCDHIFVSQGLIGKVKRAFVAHGEYAQSCSDFYYSDHWPVVIDLEL
jgi:endonuclease/exonuclease/phosphatase family metal-dependent hydrolase